MKVKVLCLALLVSGPAFAGAGEDGFQVLTLSASPRQAALAETGAAESPDADSFSLNPGALGLLWSPEASLSHAGLPLSVNLESMAYAHPFERAYAAGRVTVLDAGGFAGYDASGGRNGTVQAKDFLASAGYGMRLDGGSGLGISLTQARSTIGQNSAAAWGIGAGWVRPLGRLPLRFSAAVRNVGSKGSFVREKTGLPQVALAGLSYRGWNGALMTALEVRNVAGESVLAAGVEGWMYNSLALRAGWDGARDLGGGLSFGVGFRLQTLRVDYAFQPQGGAFAAVHRMGVSFRFGRAGDRAYQEGMRLAQQGRYAEAIFKFKESLDADPGRKEAVRALREALSSLEKETGGDK